MRTARSQFSPQLKKSAIAKKTQPLESSGGRHKRQKKPSKKDTKSWRCSRYLFYMLGVFSSRQQSDCHRFPPKQPFSFLLNFFEPLACNRSFFFLVH
ncbi:hypothetical protein BX070DRAFT_43414 [Coemansia spiralis]|nr:hypothetical protein BX070DRAFT_43414 [Coemansia spiralis]